MRKWMIVTPRMVPGTVRGYRAPMAKRRRIRVRRTAGFLLLVAVLFGLLELNRFLPGGWPGGGGDGGFRRWPVSASDRTRVRPPEGELPPLPPDGIQVVLRVPGGGAPTGAAVGVDREGTTPRRADSEGRVRIDDPAVLSAGLRVGLDGAEVRHGPADPTGAGTWTVHLPPHAPPPSAAPGPVRLEVVAAEDGRALAGAAVTIYRRADVLVQPVDTDGGLVLEGLEERTLVTVEAPGRSTVRRWVHPRAGDTVRIRVPRVPRLSVEFVDAETGAALDLTGLRVLTPAGEVLWRSDASLGTPVSRTLDVRAGVDLADALLEVRTASHPVVHIPLADLGPEVRIPAGRVFEVQVRDNDAQRLHGGRVRAHYIADLLGAPEHRPAEPVEVAVEGGTEISLPAGTPARLLVEAAASAPRTITVLPDADPRREVRLAPGIPLIVRVSGESGEPVEGAEVVVHTSPDGVRVTRRGRTLADGRATIRDLPGGPVEVYAHAPGMAWAVVATEAARGREPIEVPLAPGLPLRLVVESPLGLPLAGVRVRTTPTEDGAVEIVGPDATPRRTREDGTLVLTDLPDRPYRLRFSLPGYGDAVVHDVRPGPGVHFVTLLPEGR